MDGNLDFQYEEFLNAVEQYQLYAEKASGRIFNFGDGRQRGIEFIKKLPEMWREVKPLSGRTPNWLWKMISQNVSDEEKHNEFYPVLVSDYRTNSLCDYLVKRFHDFDFEKLKELHALKQIKLSRFNYFREHTIILAVATILLKTVPKSVVEQYTGYALYEKTVFWVTVGLLCYLLLLVLPFWLRHKKAIEDHARIGDLLTYIAIKQKKKTE